MFATTCYAIRSDGSPVHFAEYAVRRKNQKAVCVTKRPTNLMALADANIESRFRYYALSIHSGFKGQFV